MSEKKSIPREQESILPAILRATLIQYLDMRKEKEKVEGKREMPEPLEFEEAGPKSLSVLTDSSNRRGRRKRRQMISLLLTLSSS